MLPDTATALQRPPMDAVALTGCAVKLTALTLCVADATSVTLVTPFATVSACNTWFVASAPKVGQARLMVVYSPTARLDMACEVRIVPVVRSFRSRV